MKTKIRILFFFLFMLVSYNIQAQNTYYVNNAYTPGVDIYCTAAGNDATNVANNPNKPSATLSDAITAAANGDTIYVDAGTYAQNTILITKQVTIIGAGTGKTIFDNSDGGQLWGEIKSSNVIIKNMTMTQYYNANSSKAQVIDINGTYTGVILDGILITGCLGAGSTLPNINIAGGANVKVKNSLLKCSGYNGAAGGGILVNNSTAEIQSTVFYQNESGTGIGGGLKVTGPSANVTITNCSFYGCVSLRGGAIGQDGGTLSITGSCFANNFSESDDTNSGGGAIFISGTSNTTISNCTFDTNAATNQSKGGSTSGNPISIGNATTADGAALCFKSVTGNASITNCSFTNNGKVTQIAGYTGVIGSTLINSFDDGQDIYYSGASLNITISNNSFSSANSGEVNIFEDGSGNQTMSNNGIYTHTGSTGTTVSTLLTTRTDVTGATATGWTDSHITGTTTINVIGSLLTPIRTGVFSTCSTTVFAGWTDTNVTQSGTCSNTIGAVGYLALNTATSTTISPAMDFTTSTASKYLTFRAMRHSSVNAAKNIVTVSISTNNGSNWTVLGTRTTASTSLTQMTPFDLSAYTGTQVRIKFESLTADGTIGIGIDDIIITNASTMITPTMDFSNKGVQVLYTQALVGGTNTTYNVVQPFISENNGTTWTALTSTNTAGTYTLDLSAYHSATTKIKFETPYANGTTGVSLDNITFNSAAASNDVPVTYCQNPSSISGCNTTIVCGTETAPPVILTCVPNKTVACGTTLADYRSEVSAYDDCSFSVTQSPAAGTALSGTTTVTMTVTDQKGNLTTCTFTVTVNSSTWNGTEWSNGTPTSSTAVTFTGNFSSTADLAACSVQVTNNAAVVINSGHNYTVQNAVTVDSGSTFTFNNNANLVQVNNVSNTGNIIMKRDTNPLKRLDYTIWSAPVAGQNLLAFSPSTLTNRFYTYNTATDAHSAVNPSTTSFATGLGYQIRVPNDHPISTPTTWTGTFTGVPNNGPYNVTISSAGNRYNMVGNPYPSPINLTTFSTVNSANFTGTIWFWRKENSIVTQGVWSTWNAGTFVLASDPGTSGLTITDNVARNGQGFLIKGNSGITTLSFTNAMRVTNTSNQFFRTEASDLNRIWLNLTSASGHFSQQAVRYSEGGTNELDRMDAENINNSDVLFTSLRSNVATETNKFTIQSRQYPFDVNDVVPLSVKISTAGTYSISIHQKDGLFEDGSQAIYLKDNLTNNETNLNNGSYSFVSDAGVFDARFELKYVASALSNDQKNFENNVVVYQQNEIIHINSNVEPIQNVKIFDIRGRLIHTADNINATSTNVKLNIEKQLLLMRITMSNGAVITRKILN